MSVGWGKMDSRKRLVLKILVPCENITCAHKALAVWSEFMLKRSTALNTYADSCCSVWAALSKCINGTYL